MMKGHLGAPFLLVSRQTRSFIALKESGFQEVPTRL